VLNILVAGFFYREATRNLNQVADDLRACVAELQRFNAHQFQAFNALLSRVPGDGLQEIHIHDATFTRSTPVTAALSSQPPTPVRRAWWRFWKSG
jgi:hypothetical protein